MRRLSDHRQHGGGRQDQHSTKAEKRRNNPPGWPHGGPGKGPVCHSQELRRLQAKCPDAFPSLAWPGWAGEQPPSPARFGDVEQAGGQESCA
ncbi:MAG: hypothetical protein ACK55Z_01290, partial [bacterium]